MRRLSRSMLALAMLMAALGGSGCSSLRSLKPEFPALPTSTKKVDDLNASAELSPAETAKACIATAETLESQGHNREAVLLYEKARRLDAGAIDYSRRLAALYDRLDDGPSALREYQAALRISPRDPDLLNDFGYHHMKQGSLTQSEQLYRDALKLQPEHQHVRMNLAVNLAKQGRQAESYELFASVVGPAAAHYNLGVVLAKEGRSSDARHALSQALAMNPQLRQAEVFLSALPD
jgi:Tfp pilus assembly protein PilF